MSVMIRMLPPNIQLQILDSYKSGLRARMLHHELLEVTWPLRHWEMLFTNGRTGNIGIVEPAEDASLLTLGFVIRRADIEQTFDNCFGAAQ